MLNSCPRASTLHSWELDSDMSVFRLEASNHFLSRNYATTTCSHQGSPPALLYAQQCRRPFREHMSIQEEKIEGEKPQASKTQLQASVTNFTNQA